MQLFGDGSLVSIVRYFSLGPNFFLKLVAERFLALYPLGMEVSQAEFARKAHVSSATICEMAKGGRLIKNSAGKLDTENQINRAYLDKRHRKFQDECTARQALGMTLGEEKAKTIPLPDLGKNAGSAGAPIDSPNMGNGKGLPLPATELSGLPEYMLGLTIRELVVRYNGIVNLQGYVKTLKELMIAAEKDQRIKERQQAKIDKDFVQSKLFGYVDNVMNQLLDYPLGTVDQIIAFVKSLSDDESLKPKLSAFIQDGIESIICGSKDAIMKELNALKGKYSEADILVDIRDQLEETAV